MIEATLRWSWSIIFTYQITNITHAGHAFFTCGTHNMLTKQTGQRGVGCCLCEAESSAAQEVRLESQIGPGSLNLPNDLESEDMTSLDMWDLWRFESSLRSQRAEFTCKAFTPGPKSGPFLCGKVFVCAGSSYRAERSGYPTVFNDSFMHGVAWYCGIPHTFGHVDGAWDSWHVRWPRLFCQEQRRLPDSDKECSICSEDLVCLDEIDGAQVLQVDVDWYKYGHGWWALQTFSPTLQVMLSRF